MSEYRKYKGYYIGPGCFNNEADIDSFLEQQALESFKTACWLFVKNSSMEASIYCSERAEYLVNQFGYTWEQIEEIEIENFKVA